jgi:hypothetical protein
MSVIAIYRQPRFITCNRSKIRHMKAFHSEREAKEFFVSQIAAEAQRANVPLSEVERKMLYFTESGWTLPDIMEVSEDFGRDYDQNKYEKKMTRLIRNAYKHARKESRGEYEAWWAAIRYLKKEDHYISVMIGTADLRPAGDQLRLFGTALAIVVGFLLVIFLSIKFHIDLSRHAPSRDAIYFFIWATGVCIAITYVLLRFVVGRKRRDELTSKVLETLVRIYQRSR